MDGIVTTKPRQVYSQNANRTQFYNPFTTVLGPERLRKELNEAPCYLSVNGSHFYRSCFHWNPGRAFSIGYFFSATKTEAPLSGLPSCPLLTKSLHDWSRRLSLGIRKMRNIVHFYSKFNCWERRSRLL